MYTTGKKKETSSDSSISSIDDNFKDVETSSVIDDSKRRNRENWNISSISSDDSSLSSLDNNLLNNGKIITWSSDTSSSSSDESYTKEQFTFPINNKSEVQLLRNKITKLEEENKKLRETCKQLQEQNSQNHNLITPENKIKVEISKPQNQNFTEIAEGVSVPTNLLKYYAERNKKATLFARNLMRTVFTTEELTTSSLWGKMANSGKDKKPLPALDPIRLRAVIDYTLKRETPEARRLVLWDVKRSLSTLLLEMRKKQPAR